MDSQHIPAPPTRSDEPPRPPADRSIIPPPPGPGQSTRSAPGSERDRRSTPADGPVFPHDRLAVQRWDDPVLDYLGHDPRSPYVERFWLAVLGPSCLFLLRRLAAELERSPDGFVLVAQHWAPELGLGMRGGKHGPFWRSIERACRFNTARRTGDRLVVRRRLPPLSSRQVSRLPEHLQDAHRQWAEEQQRLPRRKTLSAWNEEHGSGAA